MQYPGLRDGDSQRDRTAHSNANKAPHFHFHPNSNSLAYAGRIEILCGSQFT